MIKHKWFYDDCYKLRRSLQIKGRWLKGDEIIDNELVSDTLHGREVTSLLTTTQYLSNSNENNEDMLKDKKKS